MAIKYIELRHFTVLLIAMLKPTIYDLNILKAEWKNIKKVQGIPLQSSTASCF